MGSAIGDGEIGSARPGGVLDPHHVRVLEARGLDPELAAMLGWWTLPSGRAGGGEPALVIPYWRGGRIAGRKFRTFAPKRFWQDAHGDAPGQARKLFWNEDVLRDDTLRDQPLLIAEGELDALAAMQAGFARTVSVPDGAPHRPVGDDDEGAKYDYLREALPLLGRDRVGELVLAADGDGPGANLLHDLSIRLGRARCRYLRYPKPPPGWEGPLKDLGDVLRAYGEKGVTETVLRAPWLKVDGVYAMDELPPVPERQVFPTGFAAPLDAMYKIRLGDFAVVTGIPSHGKSTWVNDLCCRAVSAHGLRAAFASFEQHPQLDHRRSLRAWFHRKEEADQTADELAAADAWINSRFCFVVPGDDEDTSLEWLLEKLEIAAVRFGANIVVVDPWNELDHQRARDETTTEYVGRAIKALRRFARAFNVHLVVVAHPTKPARGGANEPPPPPSLYDISDSANWYNKADLGVVVHRQIDGSTLIRTAKSRYHDRIGKPGQCACAFVFGERRFHPMEG